MFSRRTPRPSSRKLRALWRGRLALLFVVVFSTSLLGSFWPVIPGYVDCSTPFPCQAHGCGCPDAESCWRDCCCYSAAEKVAWARQWGCEPPADVVAQAERETCQAASNPPASEVDLASLPPCCRKRAEQAAAESASAVDTSPTARWAMPELVRRCRGWTPVWLSLAAALPPPAAPGLTEPMPRVDLLPAVGRQVESVAHRPEIPPPRLLKTWA